MILIGGTFSLHGAVLGAIFLVMIDPFLTYLKDDLPGIIAGIAFVNWQPGRRVVEEAAG